MTTALRIYRRSELEAISEGCLKRYRDIWVDGVSDMSDVALVGIAFASIKHHYIQRLVDHQIPQDEDDAKEAFVEGIAAVQTPTRLIPDIRQLWQFHAEKFELPLEKFVAAEERGSEGDVGWTPDLVLAHPAENTLEVIDDKSGWHPPLTEDEVKRLFQARVYSRYARDRWPNFSLYRFTLHAVRYNKYTSVVFSQSELDTVELEVRAAIATIKAAQRTNHWPAVAGPSCHFCELACPIADQPVTLPKRLTVEQYQKLGAWLLVADKQLRAAKKLMKAQVNIFGPCDVNGVVWNNREVVSKSYPANVVVQALEKVERVGGLDPTAESDLTISQSALKPFLKRFPALANELETVVREKSSYRFSAKQAGVGEEAEED